MASSKLCALPRRDYRTLDAIVVTASLGIMGFVMWALTFRVIPQANLPILAALSSGTFGAALGAYVGARWGNKKPTSEDTPQPVVVRNTDDDPAKVEDIQP